MDAMAFFASNTHITIQFIEFTYCNACFPEVAIQIELVKYNFLTSHLHMVVG